MPCPALSGEGSPTPTITALTSECTGLIVATTPNSGVSRCGTGDHAIEKHRRSECETEAPRHQ